MCDSFPGQNETRSDEIIFVEFGNYNDVTHYSISAHGTKGDVIVYADIQK